MSPMRHMYEVDLNWNNDRKGTLSSRVLHDNINVATPPQFPNMKPKVVVVEPVV